MARNVEQKLTELYLSNLDLIGEGFPAAFNRLRQGHVEALKLGAALPAKKDERFHLVDAAGLYSGEWEYYFTPPVKPIPEDKVCGGVFGSVMSYPTELHNGFSDGQLHTEENGMVYGSLRKASFEVEAVVEQYFGEASVAGREGVEPLAGLNSVFVQDGAFIYIPDGVQAEHPLVVDCRYLSPGEDISCFARVLVVLGRSAKAEVVVMHRGGEGAGVLANSVCEVVAGEGAQIKLSVFSCMNTQSTLLDSNYITQQRNSRSETTCVVLGGRASRFSYRTDLTASGAEAGLDGLYLAAGKEHTAIDIRVNHLAPDCRSREMVKGVAAGQAVGSFTGRVYVAPDAQRTEAMQQSRNIELSGEAKIYARPQLEIYADDVKCSHGATVGQLDTEALYYMRQRGIDLRTARRLQLEGFIQDVTSHYGFGRAFFNDMIHKKME